MTSELTFAVATYNVHRFVGRDRRSDPVRIAAVVRELDADVVALQEVPFPTEAWHETRARDLLPGVDDYQLVAAPTCRRGGRHFGNALLARLPVRAVERLDLSVPYFEPRGALDADLETPAGRMKVVATHLGLVPYERRRQFARLCAHLQRTDTAPLVVLGDFNEWRARARGIRTLERVLGTRTIGAPSFPTPRPFFALDRIWVRPLGSMLRLAAHKGPLACRASDHFPVVAHLRAALAVDTSPPGPDHP